MKLLRLASKVSCAPDWEVWLGAAAVSLTPLSGGLEVGSSGLASPPVLARASALAAALMFISICCVGEKPEFCSSSM